MRIEEGSPSFSTALPSAEPFVMNFYTHRTSYPDSHYASYSCQSYTRAESRGKGGEEPLCYDLDRAPAGQGLCGSGDVQTGGPWRVQPQDDCDGTEVMPLNSDLAAVRSTIRGLRGSGAATYSSFRDCVGDPGSLLPPGAVYGAMRNTRWTRTPACRKSWCC